MVPPALDYRVLHRLPKKGRKRIRLHLEVLRNFRQDAAIRQIGTKDETEGGSETEPDAGGEFERDDAEGSDA